MSENIVEGEGVGTITAHCLICDDRITELSKGLGRAILAAWKTRHQHTDDAGVSDE